jgi:ribosome-associated protein
MTDPRRSVRDLGFEPLECSIPVELTIAEYRNRRASEGAPTRPERRAPKLRLRALIRR